VSTATLRRLVTDGRLEPDVVAPGTGDLLFEAATVRHLHRRAQSPKHTQGLIGEQRFAAAVRQPVSWVRRMQERGNLAAAWVHVLPAGGVTLFFTPADVEAHRQAS
jgi:hypothetical protein